MQSLTRFSRPTISKLTVARFLLPSVIWIGSPGFRRFILELLPSRTVQSAREMIDLMDKTSHEVLRAKREAMQQGDEAVLQQIGSGKDIMSILRAYIFGFCSVLNHGLSLI